MISLFYIFLGAVQKRHVRDEHEGLCGVLWWVKVCFQTLQNRDLLFVATVVAEIFPVGVFFSESNANFYVIFI